MGKWGPVYVGLTYFVTIKMVYIRDKNGKQIM